MNRLMGLETEYGLFIEGVDVGALTTEARTLVQSGPGGPRWDYRGESPLQDLRGFRASRLITNPRDEEVERTAKAPEPRTPHEDHVDRVLLSGARFYHDHGHPEYSTPECRTLKDLLTHDRAGEQVVWAAARAYTEWTGRRVWVYKNNSDYHGMSYGCHENYLVNREIPFERLVAGLLPFLVTRVLFTGAGKVGAEAHVRPDERIPYQLSQRADFFDEVLSVDTLHRRPLMNTRDEPHCDPKRWRRLHVICGDANLSEYSAALKLGTTALALDLLERGYGPPVELKDPVRTVRALSREVAGGWLVETREERTIPAVDVQRAYLRSAQELAAGRDPETDWLLREWETVLDDLERDPRRLGDRLDWAAKRALLEDFLASEGQSWETADLELLQSLELEYHNIDLQAGLFWALQDQGAIRRITKEKEIERARQVPPRDTRAYLRGLCLRRFEVEAAGWSRLVVRDGGLRVELDLSSCVDRGTDFLTLPADATLRDVVEWVAQTRAEADARR
jgi:proteasome accessory factor A